jgi:hypothetical protein
VRASLSKAGKFLRRAWADWRVKLIVGFVVVAIAATCCDYYEGFGLNPETHFGAVFAAWVGGLALFVITGIVVAIVSLAKPEEESFDSRARILFRRETGKHIDYIVSKLKAEFEHYAESTILKVTIRDFHVAEKKYRVSSVNDAVVRSYIDDVETTYSTTLKIEDATLPPSGGASNRLVSVKVGDGYIGTAEQFTTSISRPIACRVDQDSPCDVCTMTEFWVLADDEPNSHVTRRYTQRLTLHFENLLPVSRDIQVKLTTDGINWITERLSLGQTKKVAEFKDIKPGIQLFEYRILGP